MNSWAIFCIITSLLPIYRCALLLLLRGDGLYVEAHPDGVCFVQLHGLVGYVEGHLISL